MNPFAFVIGKCTWAPVSAKAALAFLVYFYGINPEFTTEDYVYTMGHQMMAAGLTEDEAVDKIKWLDQCMLDAYTPQKEQQ